LRKKRLEFTTLHIFHVRLRERFQIETKSAVAGIALEIRRVSESPLLPFFTCASLNFSYRREWKDRKGKGYALRAMQQARVIKAIIIINLQMSSLVE